MITIKPNIDYSFSEMKIGALQHLDRNYTYDVIPKELLGGQLFQGIYRLPKGTSIQFKLFDSAIVYFFFHSKVDGGYTEIFANLKGWEYEKVAPQYDVHHGDYGLTMTMYKLEGHKNTIYTIPATTKERACFGMVFQYKK